MPRSSNHLISFPARRFRPWNEIKDEARRASEDMGISLDRALRLILENDRSDFIILNH